MNVHCVFKVQRIKISKIQPCLQKIFRKFYYEDEIYVYICYIRVRNIATLNMIFDALKKKKLSRFQILDVKCCSRILYKIPAFPRLQSLEIYIILKK